MLYKVSTKKPDGTKKNPSDMRMISSKNLLQLRYFFILAMAAMLLVITVLRAFCLEVIITRTNGKDEKGILEKMGEDGSLTLKIQGGTVTLSRDQYLKVVSNEKPAEIAAAEQQYKSRRYADALKSYQTAYDKYKWLNWGEVALEGIGNCYRELGDNSNAVESYNKFIKQFPRSAGTYRVKYSMALSYRSLGNKTESLALFNEVIDSTDDVFTVYALSNVGDMQFEQKEYEQALRSYLRIVVLYENLKNAEAKVREAKINAGKCYDRIIENTSSEKDRTALQKEKERITK